MNNSNVLTCIYTFYILQQWQLQNKKIPISRATHGDQVKHRLISFCLRRMNLEGFTEESWPSGKKG